jgi:hypothetical protein
MVDVAVTEQTVQHEAAFNIITTSFHYIKHERNDKLQLIITVVCATGSLLNTDTIYRTFSKASLQSFFPPPQKPRRESI